MARPYLGNPKYTIEVLQKYGFVFQKRFGQNFLIDTHVLERIIEASEITKDDFVLEIGPGIGTMTQYLAEAAREVTAVEIDDALIPILKDTLKEWDNVTVLHGDILKTDIPVKNSYIVPFLKCILKDRNQCIVNLNCCYFSCCLCKILCHRSDSRSDLQYKIIFGDLGSFDNTLQNMGIDQKILTKPFLEYKTVLLKDFNGIFRISKIRSGHIFSSH